MIRDWWCRQRGHPLKIVDVTMAVDIDPNDRQVPVLIRRACPCGFREEPPVWETMTVAVTVAESASGCDSATRGLSIAATDTGYGVDPDHLL